MLPANSMSQIRFNDAEVNGLDLTDSYNGLIKLITEYLCNRDCSPELVKRDNKLLIEMATLIKEEGITHNQFNELLLLLNQDKIGEGFFNYFFKVNSESGKVELDELRNGINRFRGFALLKFGNFRFAYKRLINKTQKEVEEKLEPYSLSTDKLEQQYKGRPTKMLEIEDIPRKDTWYVGEFSGSIVNKEIIASEEEVKKAQEGSSSFGVDEISEFRQKLKKMDLAQDMTESQAFRNTDVYLTWNYMDVYVATSMRYQWEYEETFDFTREVFGSRQLRNLNLRYFDPTQSKCRNPREKGLVEGLMLRRSFCTIYLAQESDTMGKDSELAATLAQGKPVVAYVPKLEPISYSKKIATYPLGYFRKRLGVLEAEESIDKQTVDKLREFDNNFEETIDSFLSKVYEYRSRQKFQLWTEKNDEFKKDCKEFPKICRILAIAESDNFENRATLFRERHPLAMQVNLHTGVANGVLVVRNSKECTELLMRLLTNRANFDIRHDDQGFTVLEEDVSKSPFRVVTDNERLTNSFWNLFF
jgi:hypothetical protein